MRTEKDPGRCRFFNPAARFFHYAYAQRGILCDFENHELTAFFTEKLKDFLKANGMAYMRMDPYVEYQQLNPDGSVAEGGFINQHIIDFLASLGYEHLDLPKTTLPTPRSDIWSFLILMTRMIKPSPPAMSRTPGGQSNRVRKFGVEIEELTPDNLGDFMELMEFTSEKRHFTDLGLDNYRAQMEAFGPDNAKSRWFSPARHSDGQQAML